MRKSLKKAKQDALAVWRYLAEHGEIRDKDRLPEKLFRKIRYDDNRCPLCTIFMGGDCFRCPLCVRSVGWCGSSRHPYHRWNDWHHKHTSKERTDAAREIVKLIEAWEV